MSLPSLEDAISSQSSLETLLSTLLEPTSSLSDKLVPSLSSALQSSTSKPSTYGEVIDQAEQELKGWSTEERADFLGGHPRIGEVKNLSALSSKEQNNAQKTPPEVLGKLETLNALYESKYPTLRYVTFVNGRSRAEIASDLESFLMSSGDGQEKDDEGVSTEVTATYQPGSQRWNSELDRGIADVFRIAKARLKGLGLQ